MSKVKRCSFCREAARGSYGRTRFCAGHLTMFYLSLNLEWTD